MKTTVSIKMNVYELAVGMKVMDLDRPWIETDFMMQGFIIESQSEIDSLIRQCEYVYIEGGGDAQSRNLACGTMLSASSAQPSRCFGPKVDLGITEPQKGLRQSGSASSKAKAVKIRPPVHYINKIPFSQEIGNAEETYLSAKSIAEGIINGIRIGRSLNVSHIKKSVNSVVDSLLNNSNTLMWLAMIKSQNEGVAEHSLNVCILSVSFAMHLGHSLSEVEKIGLGGLLHDIGKSKIPTGLIEKQGQFSQAEKVMLRKHSTYARNLLMSQMHTEPSCIDTAHSHHERVDGSGYPRGLVSHQIPYYAKIVALTDTFDNLTNSSYGKSEMSSMDALEWISQKRNTYFDSELTDEFIKCIGAYSPGSIVELISGDIGVVVDSDEKSHSPSKVLLLKNLSKDDIKPKIITLAPPAVGGQVAGYGVKCELADGAYGIHIDAMIKKGLILHYPDTAETLGSSVYGGQLH